jgi:aryl-alcohol dehydrogenase-like predicted oxidoreductase
VLRSRREEVFLTTKAPKDGYKDVLDSLEQSLDELGVSHVDLAFLHSIGGRDIEVVLSGEGAFAGLEEARRRGWCRFIGFTGHHQPWKAVRALEELELDAVMVAMNYVDRFTYDFEGRVLPLARRRGVGVLAMKAFGGARDMKYDRPRPSAFDGLGQSLLEQAYYYSATLEGVASVIVGVFSERELEQNVAWAHGVRELTDQEEQQLEQRGREAAQTLGEHFGPLE